MPSSLRSLHPDGFYVVSDRVRNPPRHENASIANCMPDSTWTPVPYKGWVAFFPREGRCAKITHEGCWWCQWWGPLFHKTDNTGEVCSVCWQEIPVAVEDYLLKAWEMYVL